MLILGSPSTSSITKPSSPSTSASMPTVSSAPQIEDFTPPEPTPTDPYPGYYLLPNGSWAAYDPMYYKKIYDKWQSEYNTHVRALEKGMVKGFEGLETAGAHEVDALAEMERAKKEIQEREEKKALTHGAGGAPAAPRMNIKVRFLCLPASTLTPSPRERNWAGEHALGISLPLYSLRLTKTGRLWRRESQRGGEIERRRAINMVK
jgi:hypothetical protein